MSNADKAKPEVLINLDRPRRFCLDWNAMRALEKKIGKNAIRAIDWNDPGYEDMTLIIWAGLLSEDPSLTDHQVGEHLSVAKLTEINAQITEAIRAAMPSVDESEQKKTPANETATT